jgi:hypothetical protein
MSKLLTIDVETSPLESYHWGLFDQYIGVDFIKVEWSILSFAAKWADKKAVIYADTGGRGAAKVRDDKPLVKQIWTLLDEADIVVAQNGQRFDVKKINARLIMHGLGPYSPIRVVDTLLVAKKHFAFTSNKLAWMSKYLTDSPKDEHKRFPGFELWKECLADNPKAWAEMKKYNKKDVVATEKLYLRQLPWISQHPNMGVYTTSEAITCPKCASTRVTKQGTKAMQQGLYQQYKCLDCGGWSRGKKMLLDLPKRRSLLVGT